jgi:hypothetical protein
MGNFAKRKSGQAWGFDLIIGVSIFTMGLALFYVYSLNYPSETEELLNSMNYQGGAIADSLLTEGSPYNWDVTNVARIGLTTNDKINQTKLENFYILADPTLPSYGKTKALFSTNYDFYVNFSVPIMIGGVSKTGIGKSPDPPNNPTNMMKISRYTIYNNNPVVLNVIIWQ